MVVIDEESFIPNPDYLALEAMIEAGLFTEHDKTYQFNDFGSSFRRFWYTYCEKMEKYYYCPKPIPKEKLFPKK